MRVDKRQPLDPGGWCFSCANNPFLSKFKRNRQRPPSLVITTLIRHNETGSRVLHIQGLNIHFPYSRNSGTACIYGGDPVFSGFLFLVSTHPGSYTHKFTFWKRSSEQNTSLLPSHELTEHYHRIPSPNSFSFNFPARIRSQLTFCGRI